MPQMGLWLVQKEATPNAATVTQSRIALPYTMKLAVGTLMGQLALRSFQAALIL